MPTPWATAAPAAEALVLAAAQGASPELVELLVDALVDQVLDAEHHRLALEADAGGPFRVRRALDLAAVVLRGAAAGADAPSRQSG